MRRLPHGQGRQALCRRVPLQPAFGTLYSSNITPDKETGIGAWSDADFLTAVREGVAPDGTHLYPAFPYTSYTMMTDEDVLAIKAYLFSLPPVKQATAPNTFSFPFNQRWTMAIWSAFFNPNERYRPNTAQSAAWNRGAYIAEAMGHCGDCHTPRSVTQAMDHRKKFMGAVAAGWKAYNLTPDKETGVGAWSDETWRSSSTPAMSTATAPPRAPWAKRSTTASAT